MSLADRILADYRRAFARAGDDIIIRRYADADRVDKIEAKVRARVTVEGAERLVDGQAAQARYGIVAINDPAAEVESGYVALSSLLPLVEDVDYAVIGGREILLRMVDDQTRRINGTLTGLNLVAVG